MLLLYWSFSDLDKCPYCSQPRYNSNGHPQKRFTYAPLIPRLQSFFLNPKFSKEMQYQGTYQPKPDVISDIMDSSNYQELCTKFFSINRKTFLHLFLKTPTILLLDSQLMASVYFDEERRLVGHCYFTTTTFLLRFTSGSNI